MQEPVIVLKSLELGYLLLILPALLPGACRDCAQPGAGGPASNPYTAYDTVCKGSGCRQIGFPQVSVNTANLTLFVHVSDLVFGGPAPALAIGHSFNMDDTGSGILGPGWSFSLGDTITPDPDGSLVLHRGTGRIDRFAAAPGRGAFFAVTPTRDTLSPVSGGGYRLRSASSGTAWNFRSDGKLASIEDGALTRVTLSYDAAGHLSAAVYRGRTIQFTFDDSGHLSQLSDAADRSVSFSYSPDGHLTGTANANGSTAAYEYDAAGNLASITYNGGKYSIAYTGDAPYRSVAGVKAPDGATRQYDIPRTPSETRVTDGNGDATLYTSTAEGLLRSVRDSAGNTTAFTYDASGNRTSSTNPAGETTSFVYDSSGNLTSVTDAANNRWTGDYSFGQLVRITDPRKNVWTLQYDAAGYLTSVTDPLSGTATAARNASGQIISITDAAGNKSGWQYGADALIAAFTDGAGNKATYAYDGAARTSSRTDGDGRTLNAGYNEQNRISSLGVNDAFLSFDYSGLRRDSTGRATQYTDSAGNTVGYQYDDAGQLISLTLPGGKTVTYQYDHQHRLSAVSDWAGNTALYRYDAAGFPISLNISGGPITIWQYDTARNLRSIVSTGPDGTPVAGYRYTFDAAGNRTAASALEPYGGDVSVPSYTFTYDAAKRPLTRSDGQNYGYDSLGNLLAIGGSRTVTFNYDVFGRLSGVAAENSTRYGYDSAGLRTKRNDRTYVWDPSGSRPRLVMEADGSGNPIAWYVYGLGLLWKVTADGTPYFYHFDGEGNVVAVSNTAGSVVNQYRYGPAGNLLGSSEGVENLFRARAADGWIDDGNGLLFTGTEFRFPELGLSLPAMGDPSPPVPGLLPQLRGTGACLFNSDRPVACQSADGRDR